MPISESRKKANSKWNEAHPYEQVQVRLLDGLTKEKIKTHTDGRGESVNAFINRAIIETMTRDVETAQAPCPPLHAQHTAP